MRIIINILIALLVLFKSSTCFSQEQVKKITLEEIHTNNTFHENTVSGLRSMNNGEFFTTLEESQKIVKYSYATGEVVEVLFNNIESDFKIEDYEFSADESKILLAVNAHYIYRRSYEADHYIYNIASKNLVKLSANGKQKYAAFSPNALKVAFVRNNNIFIKDLKSDEEKQITNDGKFNFIINGGTDWVYEEEFMITRDLFW